MKKLIALLLVMMLVLTGCVGGNEPQNSTTVAQGNESQPTGEKVKVAMVTDSGTIDDKSFNQGTWEGVKKYEAESGKVVAQYLQPESETEAAYLNSIAALVDNGVKVIVTPGFKFETAIFKAQELYPDVHFILIDGQPNDGDYAKGPVFKTADNTVSIFFQEEQAGFLAGVAAALSTKTGKLGFVGGMEIPPVQRFGWGYQSGVKYANEQFGAKAEVVDYVYQGTFVDAAAGQTLASGMYSKGVDIIFQAAGGVGLGVFSEAIERASKGEEVYVVGVDLDQYDFGKISDAPDAKSVTITSAVKGIDVAAYRYVDESVHGKFPGGQVVRLSLQDDAVGIPAENPNLSADTVAKVNEAKKAVLEGKFTVPSTQEELDAYLK